MVSNTISSFFIGGSLQREMIGIGVRPEPLSDREVIGFLFADFYE